MIRYQVYSNAFASLSEYGQYDCGVSLLETSKYIYGYCDVGTVRFLDVAKFTTLNPVSLIISCCLLLGNSYVCICHNFFNNLSLLYSQIVCLNGSNTVFPYFSPLKVKNFKFPYGDYSQNHHSFHIIIWDVSVIFETVPLD
jgi:hypothetical protein